MTEIITNETKLAAVKREIRYRKHVYPRLIEQGKITDGHANSQIAIFEAIEADYARAVEKERLI